MDKKSKILTALVASVIHGESSVYLNTDEIELETLYRQAVQQHVHTLLYPAIKSSHHKNSEKRLLDFWKTNTFHYGILFEVNCKIAEELFRQILKEGIQIIMMKGIVFKTLYHHSQLRFMNDIDILVEDRDIPKVTEILNKNGYIANKDKKTKHVQFQKEGSFLVEIHRALSDEDSIKNKADFTKAVWDSKIEFNLNGLPIYTLSWNNQLLHMGMHMVSHILHGGFNLRQLCDFVLLVEQKEIDWAYVQKKSEEYGIHKFMCVIFDVCKSLFNLKTPDCFAMESTEYYTDKVINDMFRGGRDIVRMSENYIPQKSNINFIKRINHIFSMLFPSYEKLSKRYSYMYIKKYPILTPIAWLHRIFYGIFRKDLNLQNKKSMLYDNKLLKIVEERDDMLHWLDIV